MSSADQSRDWQPIETAPMDGAYRFYGLHVHNNHTGYRWFEAYYVALDTVDGQLMHPNGDNFSDWTYEDFEVWAPAPPLPSPESASEDRKS